MGIRPCPGDLKAEGVLVPTQGTLGEPEPRESSGPQKYVPHLGNLPHPSSSGKKLMILTLRYPHGAESFSQAEGEASPRASCVPRLGAERAGGPVHMDLPPQGFLNELRA